MFSSTTTALMEQFNNYDDETTTNSSSKEEEQDRSQPVSIQERIQKFVDLWENELTTDHTTIITDDIMSIPKINEEEIQITKLLGRGAFADVYEAYVIDNPTEMYAIKRLRNSVLDASNDSFETCISDLAYEIAILSSINNSFCSKKDEEGQQQHHENIIKLYKIKEGNTMNLLFDGNCMIALELLQDTLEDRYKKWHKQWSRRSKLLLGVVRGSPSLHPNIVISRLETVVMGIVSAMEFLHSHKIIYRDIKPSNIGFDQQNVVKIFDFGFARLRNNDDRLMTGGVGSPRYMAPEVANYDPQYSFPADVYSFSILLWQIVTSQNPFKNIRCENQLTKEVSIGNKRPPLNFVRSKALQNLLELGWSSNPKNRPTFCDIHKVLKKIIVEHYMTFTKKKKRRSFYSSSTISSSSSSNNNNNNAHHHNNYEESSSSCKGLFGKRRDSNTSLSTADW